MAAEIPSLVLWKDDLSRLRDFHTVHFPDQELPALGDAPVEVSADEDQDDELGYYDDGVKRTLTNEQVQMFRHSEVQRLLLERRRRAEAKDQEREDSRQQAEDNAKREPSRSEGSQDPSDNRIPPHHFRFFDEPAEEDASSVGLNYDEEVSIEKPQSETKKFLWPKLG